MYVAIHCIRTALVLGGKRCNAARFLKRNEAKKILDRADCLCRKSRGVDLLSPRTVQCTRRTYVDVKKEVDYELFTLRKRTERRNTRLSLLRVKPKRDPCANTTTAASQSENIATVQTKSTSSNLFGLLCLGFSALAYLLTFIFGFFYNLPPVLSYLPNLLIVPALIFGIMDISKCVKNRQTFNLFTLIGMGLTVLLAAFFVASSFNLIINAVFSQIL